MLRPAPDHINLKLQAFQAPFSVIRRLGDCLPQVFGAAQLKGIRIFLRQGRPFVELKCIKAGLIKLHGFTRIKSQSVW